MWIDAVISLYSEPWGRQIDRGVLAGLGYQFGHDAVLRGLARQLERLDSEAQSVKAQIALVTAGW